MTYYYACSYSLAPGSVIQRGNWGRICRLESIENNTHLLKEVIFENVRLQEYPDRPSRFEIVFLCPNLDSLLNFVRITNRSYDLLYEVELVDPSAKGFETNWSLLPPNRVTMAAVEEAARRYWDPQDVDDNVKEVLVESDIRIIRRLV